MADNNRGWAVSTPGVRHDPEDVRRGLFQSTSGATGLVSAAGGGVGLTPGTPMSVRLEPCSVRVASRYPARSDESYSFSVKSPQDVAIQVTGSTARTDVVALVFWDPIFDDVEIAETDAMGNVLPGATGLDPNAIDYWYTKVFENVPGSASATTTAFREWVYDNNLIQGMVIPYAKVVQGANSVGLEGKVTPFYDSIMKQREAIAPIVTNIGSEVARGPTSGVYWTLGPEVFIPIEPWARYATFSLTVTGLFVRHSQQTSTQGSAGYLRASFLGQNTYITRWDMDINQGRTSRGTYTVARRFSVPAAMRGTSQPAQLYVTNEQSLTAVGINSGSTFITNVTFEE